MARRPRKLTVRIVPSALAQLDRIWLWNAERYGPDHADEYIGILKEQTRKLSDEYELGRIVPGRPEYRFTILRESGKGHAHVAVYWVTERVVEVLHYFHTAQDWRNKL